jgi:prepilin-type N-terminal cleavage/methylation domain-containing protein
MNFNSKAGFTLIELMVYIALLGGIVLIAGQAFSDSTKMRVRTQSMLQASQTAGNVGTILKDDIAQLGAKSAKAIDSDVFDTTHKHSVYIDPENTDLTKRDSSSFDIRKGHDDEQDTIIMLRLRYKDANADHPGAYEAVEKVTWLVDEDRVLKRACKCLEGVSTDECKSDSSSIVSIAENVDKFKLTPAKPCTEVSSVNVLPSASETDKSFKLVPRFGEENYERVNVDPENGGEQARLSGFYINYDFETSSPFTSTDMIKGNQVFVANTGSSLSSWNAQCTQVTLDPYIEYEISFSMPYSTTDDPSRMFCPGRDHMSVGFRYAENGLAPDLLRDFQFYPPTVGDDRDTGLRKMRFTAKDTIKNVCLGFTFAFFSPIASSGNIYLTNIRLKKIPSSNYTFTNETIATVDKKNVKAIKMELSINKNGETGAETAIISIPSNGPRD